VIRGSQSTRSPATSRRPWRIGRAVAAAAAMTALVASPASAHLAPARTAPEPAIQAPAPDIDVDAVLANLDRLQDAAAANGGNRATGRPGFAASSDLVTGTLARAGITATRQNFTVGGRATWNVLAEIPGTDPSRVVMIGAHLDSVQAGPGINDNGTGSMAVLQMALALRQALPRPPVTVRFAWWSGEEQGLLGSRYYVNRAPAGTLSAIQAYLNLDMIGSPNPAYQIYGDNAAIRSQFTKALSAIGIETEISTDAQGRSDHAPFEDAGVAAGGLFTGAEGIKTQAQAASWGGSPGKPFDPCYHRSCDTTQNVDRTALDRMSDVAMTVLYDLVTAPAAARAGARLTGP
jgi:aminopeptidase S